MGGQFDNSESTGELDGSAGSMYRFLSEVVGIAAQSDRTHTAPVLELQLGTLLTRTTIRKRADAHFLVILVVLPHLEKSALLPEDLAVASIFPQLDGGDAEVLWHAEDGRYVVVRHLPVSGFANETSVFDAILATGDQVSAWLDLTTRRHLHTVAEASR